MQRDGSHIPSGASWLERSKRSSGIQQARRSPNPASGAIMSRQTDLAGWIAMLPECSRQELCDHWRRLMKTEPPPNISKSLLAKTIAYAMQEKRIGGLAAATRKRLISIAKGGASSTERPSLKIKSGTRLIRVWHGEPHEVLVTDQGFYWRG